MSSRNVSERRRSPPGQTAGVLLSLAAALIFDMVSLGAVADSLRPDLALLVLVYWSTRPYSPANVATGWVVGLIRDVASLTPLGLDAGLYCLTAWVGLSLNKRMEALPIAGELLLVLLILLLGSLLSWGVGLLLGSQPSAESHLVAPLVGTLCWPLVRLAMDAIHRGAGHAADD